MRATLAPYLNDIVSLLVMALMAIALIAGQAGAAQHMAVAPAAEGAEHVMTINIDFSTRQEHE